LTSIYIYDILLQTKWRNLSDAAWCALTEAQSADRLMQGTAFAEPSYWVLHLFSPRSLPRDRGNTMRQKVKKENNDEEKDY